MTVTNSIHNIKQNVGNVAVSFGLSS